MGSVVKRGQKVWVKVLGLAGNRISLSMKDVEQATGRDLSPRPSQARNES